VEDCCEAAQIEQWPPEITILGGEDLCELGAQLDQALEQVQRLEGESRQGFESSITAAERADQMRDALTATNEQLEEVCAELAAAQQTVDRQMDELATAKEQLTALHGQLAAAIEMAERQAGELAAAQQMIND